MSSSRDGMRIEDRRFDLEAELVGRRRSVAYTGSRVYRGIKMGNKYLVSSYLSTKFAHQRRVHFMLRHARLRLEAVRGPLQRPQRRRAVRHGGGGGRRRPEMPGRGRHRLAKVTEVLRNKLERDLGDAEERATVRAGILAEVEGAGQGHRKEEGGSLFNLRPSPQSWDKDARALA